MSSNTPGVSGGDATRATRSLPSKPSLEFERKRAKALLRRLRRSDPNAKLTDAQFAVARELDFASWPRLVQYFRTLERDAYARRRVEGYESEHYDGRVQSLLAQHRNGREWAGRALAAFVPRLYGRSIAEVLTLPVTTEDARLVVARQNHCSSWEQLLEEAAAERARRGDPWAQDNSPLMRALRAMRTHGLAALQGIVDAHPELLDPSADDERRGSPIMLNALIRERRERTAEAREVTDWLVSRGMSRTEPLNELLLGHHGMTVDEVQDLLDRGAEPNWLPANGVSVLEHALMRYANAAAVDELAKHVKPRRALWIAAGLGDVDAVRRYFDRNGKPTAAAYANRPPVDLMSGGGMPALPDPDEVELLIETALIAGLNQRPAVIELLVERGYPIDYAGWGGTSLVRYAISQRDVATVRTLVRLGADLDKKGEMPHASAREFAREIVGTYPDSPELRTILEICGAGTPEEALAELDRQRPSPPPLDPRLQEAFELAGDDAARRGQSDIRGENLFIGLLRGPRLPHAFLTAGGVDLERLRDRLADRLHPASERVERPKLPFDAEAKNFVARALAIADERRRDHVMSPQLLEALIEREPGFTVDLVVACGGDLSRLRQELARA